MLHDERTISFTEAAAVVGRVTGKAPHKSTIWRWARLGLLGVRLDTQRLGRTFVTSHEALDRFSRALADASPKRNAPAKPTSKQRQASIAAAERQMRKVGIL